MDLLEAIVIIIVTNRRLQQSVWNEQLKYVDPTGKVRTDAEKFTDMRIADFWKSAEVR